MLLTLVWLLSFLSILTLTAFVLLLALRRRVIHHLTFPFLGSRELSVLLRHIRRLLTQLKEGGAMIRERPELLGRFGAVLEAGQEVPAFKVEHKQVYGG